MRSSVSKGNMSAASPKRRMKTGAGHPSLLSRWGHTQSWPLEGAQAFLPAVISLGWSSHCSIHWVKLSKGQPYTEIFLSCPSPSASGEERKQQYLWLLSGFSRSFHLHDLVSVSQQPLGREGSDFHYWFCNINIKNSINLSRGRLTQVGFEAKLLALWSFHLYF